MEQATLKLHKISEAKRILGIGQTKIYDLISTGQLEAVKLGTRTYILDSSIREFVANLPRVKAAA